MTTVKGKPKKKAVRLSGISIRLSEHDMRRINNLADKANLPRSVYMRKCLKDHLDEVCNEKD